MNFAKTTLIASCLSIASLSAFAQDAMTKPDAKTSPSMQDCKDRAAVQKGQKKSDPATADVDAKCAMMGKDDKAMMKKDKMQKKDSMTPQEAPAAPMK
jgi:hypothetical protein